MYYYVLSEIYDIIYFITESQQGLITSSSDVCWNITHDQSIKYLKINTNKAKYMYLYTASVVV